MKNTIIIAVIFILTSCSRWIAPPYTNVDKLVNVKTGMTLTQVNTELGIEPYDIYFKGNDDFIVIYNYRVKDRIVTLSGDYNNLTHSDVSQNGGSEWYGEKYFCYVYFKDKKVKSIITDKGKQKSEDILVVNNNIILIQQDNLGFYEANDSIIFVPVY
jgi:hypothetical protein